MKLTSNAEHANWGSFCWLWSI